MSHPAHTMGPVNTYKGGFVIEIPLKFDMTLGKEFKH